MPALDCLKFLSHGTLESRDLDKARAFYEECLGLDVVSREDVDRCHQLLEEGKEKWGIKRMTKPADQHGTYSFYFSDVDDNWWEILTNPAGGYAWMFSQGSDLQSWGAGKDDKVNPNAYKGRGKG